MEACDIAVNIANLHEQELQMVISYLRSKNIILDPSSHVMVDSQSIGLYVDSKILNFSEFIINETDIGTMELFQELSTDRTSDINANQKYELIRNAAWVHTISSYLLTTGE